MKPQNIVCIGILVADAVVQTVDRFPEEGKLELCDRMSLYSGGCAANAAIDLAKLGLPVSVIGMVGNDGFGSFLESELKQHRVDTAGLYRSDTCSTSASVVLVSSSGERTFLHSMGANAAFSEKNVDYSVIDRSDILFVAGTMLMPEFDGEDCAKVLSYARQHGKTTVLDTAWDSKGLWMKTLAPCMPYIDYFLPSIAEAEQLSGKKELNEMADCFYRMGVGHVVIKNGKHGCYLQSGEGVPGVNYPTYLDVRSVDTTGAGDSFCAGFLYGLAHGDSMERCCRIGNAVGTFCVQSVGSSTGIPSFAEVEHFMKNHVEAEKENGR